VDITKREIPKQEQPKINYTNINLPPKPENSDFECFGCSS
jgi:hypothetical protein